MPSATTTWRDLLRLLRHPEPFLAEHLRAGRPFASDALAWFGPALLVRPAAVFLGSILAQAPVTAAVLATSSLALQLGAWLAAGTVLPALARQLRTSIRERDALLVVGFASLPLWLAGALFVVPGTAGMPFLIWTRGLVLLLGLYGVYIAYRALGVLGVSEEARWPLVTALAATYAGVYFVLFWLLGLSSIAVLFIVGATS